MISFEFTGMILSITKGLLMKSAGVGRQFSVRNIHDFIRMYVLYVRFYAFVRYGALGAIVQLHASQGR